MSKKLTNKQRCKNCIHKIVCKWYGSYNELDYLGERCKYYHSKERAYQKKGASIGKWLKATPVSQEYCNQCGLTPKTIFGKLPPFCPNCGAKMKGGKE